MAEISQRLVEFQHHIVDQWAGKLELARKAKEPFTAIAEQCMSFYAKDHGFMWKGDFKAKHLASVETPQFEVTINKAFELVSIYGPYLFWEYPHRKVQAYQPIEADPMLFGDVQNDPMSRQLFASLNEAQGQRFMQSQMRAQLMERYLNYSQREQRPKLANQAQLAITEALIKGRGCLWAESYTFPASEQRLTGMFFDSVDNLLIDPDCTCPNLTNAQWIARKHVDTVWELERRFGIPAEKLAPHASKESNESVASHTSDTDRMKRANGQTNDLIEWYEIYSKMGVGTRMRGASSTMHESFETVIGDYAYLCVSPDVPFFLNAPPESFKNAEDEDVSEMFAWPFASWLDNRWPVALLDFNKNPDDCWPIAPLAAALGELIALNILVSAFLEQAYENRKNIIAYMDHFAEEVKKSIQNGKGIAYLKLKGSLDKSINDVIQFLNRPGMNRDILEAISFVQQMFDKRTGLVEFLYAQTSTQDRSARATAAKEEKAGIRPEKMSRDVADWLTEASELERILAAFEVQGKDVVRLVGPMGAYLWDAFITNADPEEVVREMSATVEASNVRRPNKERESANMQQTMGWMVPMLQQLAAVRGDEEGVRPLNAMIKAMGDAFEMDTSAWMLPPFAPAPDPMMQQLQQAMGQMELEKGQAETSEKQAKAQKTMIEAQMAMEGGEAENQQRQLEFDFKAAESEQDMSMAQQKHILELIQSQQKHQQQMRESVANFQMKGAQMAQAAELKRQKAQAS